MEPTSLKERLKLQLVATICPGDIITAGLYPHTQLTLLPVLGHKNEFAKRCVLLASGYVVVGCRNPWFRLWWNVFDINGLWNQLGFFSSTEHELLYPLWLYLGGKQLGNMWNITVFKDKNKEVELVALYLLTCSVAGLVFCSCALLSRSVGGRHPYQLGGKPALCALSCLPQSVN